MNVSQAVEARRSIREYLDRPVPQHVLERVLDKARMAPSGYNFQPWETVVVSGEPLRELTALIKAAKPQEPEEYQLTPPATPDHYFQRREAIMAERMGSIGIAREDKEGRARLMARNLDFFGAPTSMFVFIRRELGQAQWADLGIWLQTVMLLLVEEGLGTCPQESMYAYARLIKQFTGISDETHILWTGLAIGWPDMSKPLNNYPRPRVALEEQVRFLG